MGKAYKSSYFKYTGMIFKRMMTGKNILPKVLIALFIVIYLLTEVLSPMQAYALNFDSSTVSVRDDGGDDGHGGNSGDDTEIIPNDELGYFGTAKRTNEISTLTTNGMKDKKLMFILNVTSCN